MPAARFVWYELMTPDVAAAAAFYGAVVGWQPQPSGLAGIDYTLLKAGDASLAGIMATTAELKAMGAPPRWSGYVAVDDVAAMEARLLQAGGKLLRPAQDIPEVGRFAVVADPQGASFVLFEPLRDEPPPPPAAGTAGVAEWHELRAMDGEAVFDFYGSLFGWTKGEALPMGPLGSYQLFEIDGVARGAIMTKEPDVPAPGWRYYFRVDAIGAAAARVAAQGGRVTMGPHQVPGGSWVLHARDPQGAVFALLAPVE